ncbi:pectinesterase family protein [Xanthomonas sp. NCPPB 1067]|uniref:Pectinesterase n=1 Tax=Xanthomonas melonis TaxID=56456 RepID=A0A2S7DAG9_9XANT|nr:MULTISPECIES: pectinesterase family protein [Xanthomonas]MCC4585540.1 pectinesterase family protein [Xanthomonas sp. NCPPB 1067]MCC4601910.1 pectinesterase family protein [Xanthomonas melonis]MCD0244778.1 pectin esterase [Xanthomonas melonis]MCD0277955.1 pectin esterase [Xanthomonas melonis]PPU70805.1 pectin esterase [Xanthomonas melonis]
MQLHRRIVLRTLAATAMAAGLSLGGIALAADPVYTVAKQGNAGYRTVQAAIDAAVQGGKRAQIKVGAGVYQELIVVPANAPALKLTGAGATQTVITYDNYASRINPATGKEYGTSGSSSVIIAGNDFTAEQLSLGNHAGPVGQAVAVRVDGDRAAFRNVRFLGYQDTLYLRGAKLSYFLDCYVEGTVDFVFGAGTALFENVQLHSLGDGYLTAASTPQEAARGFVFRNARVTAASGVSRVHLGRPWRPYASVSFISSQLGKHIVPEGWNNWGNAANEATARYSEYQSSGAGANPSRRVKWSRQLTAAQAAALDRATILGNWKPF